MIKNIDEISFETKKLFEKLLKSLKSETMYLSSVDEILKNKNYNKICDLDVMPLVFKDMEKSGNVFWFDYCYLRTQQNPIKVGHEGRISKMVDDWLDWAVNNGYKFKD